VQRIAKLILIIGILFILTYLIINWQRSSNPPTASSTTARMASAVQITLVSAGSSVPTVTSFSTPVSSPMPLPTPAERLLDVYIVQSGDTLSGISLIYDVSVEELIELNGLDSQAAIIQAGQALQIPLKITQTGPQVELLPDSEIVYSPAYSDFDVRAFVTEKGGYLANYSELVDGVDTDAVEIIRRVARQYSVGPRVLLALLEYYGGWVTHSPPQSYHPLGPANPYNNEESFFLQLSWAANQVNGGYYNYKRQGTFAVRFQDNSRALIPAGLNAGTAGVQNILAINGAWETWQSDMQAFQKTYERLFGDPSAAIVEPLVPFNLTQPSLSLPWESGQTFYYTGGPHAAYGSRSAWAAVDFAPPDIKGSCYYSQQNVTAAADGRFVQGDTGEIYLDLDSDGDLRTGWVLLYLHVVARDELNDGQLVSAGTPLGYASCEGGISNSSHLHLARRYNGEWIAAGGPVPMTLSGWRVEEGTAQYDGSMVRNGVTKTACECWDPVINALTAE
jgi:LysM repeat protein